MLLWNKNCYENNIALLKKILYNVEHGGKNYVMGRLLFILE